MSSDAHIFEIKRINNHLRLVLKTTDFSGIVKALRKKFEEAGDFFTGESIVIDAYGIVQPLPWKKLAAVLEEYQIQVIGIFANARLLPTVLAEGFEHIDLSRQPTRSAPDVQVPTNRNSTATAQTKATYQTTPQTSTSESSTKASTPTQTTSSTGTASPSLLIDRQLRSGERVYASGGDLIVVGNVGSGAEIIADGNIHVYGHLLGRAIAGAKGDTNAHIFTTHLDPQLVAIAGIYRLFDGDSSPDVLKKAVMVSLNHDTLTFDPIKS